ncbi:hypothetical protein HDU76_013257 [Blyttiomyces sp. JEL0837]|nr:hypothetical protein HDU76_013257 [Blyttiomyces sp. JEL0837]
MSTPYLNSSTPVRHGSISERGTGSAGLNAGGAGAGASGAAAGGDLFRHRNKRRDDAIRKKVEQELSRKTQSKRNSFGAERSRRTSKTGTVSSLRPAAAITVLESARIVQAAQLMAAKRADAVLAVNEEGQLSGILTDKDIAYRVVAEGLDVRTTTVAQVMTRNPISVHDKGGRNEALNIMVNRRFRHLPVISADEDEDGNLIGAGNGGGGFDDESEYGGGANTATTGGGSSGTNVNEDANIVAAMEALERRGTVASDHVGVIKSLHGCPDLGTVLAKAEDDAVPEVSVKASVRDAARVMKEFHQTAVLVLSTGDGDDKLGGIFTTKDIVLRVIAANLDPATTSVVRVMTPHPDSVNTETTILEALKKLHVGHYLHLPVVDGRTPVGLVDVLTLTMAMLDYLMAKEGANVETASDAGPIWNKFWNSTFAGGSVVETESDAHSVASNGDAKSITSAGAYYHNNNNRHDRHSHVGHQQQHQQEYPTSHSPPPPSRTRSMSGTPFGGFQPPLPSHASYNPAAMGPNSNTVTTPPLHRQPTMSTIDDYASTTSPSTMIQDNSRFSFKLKDTRTSKVYRFTSSVTDLADLLGQSQSKTGIPCLSADLEEAVEMARRAGWTKLMLHAGFVPDVARAVEPTNVASGGAGTGMDANSGALVAQGSRSVVRVDERQQQQGQGNWVEFLRDAPMPVNVAISAGIVVVAAFVLSKLQRL